MDRQSALRHLIRLAMTVCIGIATAAIPAYAGQCDNVTAQKISTNPVQPEYKWLPKTPVGMDIDSSGVIVNGAVALGTFAAAAVAVWAALSDRFRRKKDDLVVARLTAAGKIHTLIWNRDAIAAAAIYVEQAISIAKSAAEPGYPKSKIPAFDIQNRRCASCAKLAHSQLEPLEVLTYEEIRNLVGMPNNCAMHIATAQALLREAIRLLSIAGITTVEPPFRDKCLHESSIHIANAKTSLDHAIRTIKRETQAI
ncbi:MAG: hypothetical protein LBJ65_16620 [Burkholderia sp.]|jgi:hypothetical protein|uniref:hypothetical protein n=1 Tax=Burkholderia sp. TaxID=36773 RepID=UPI002834D957|nr:hypothetical protein [Burkholderia sp.]MDR0243222.1 hypothetical protein [Burkholderia sp.]